MKTTSKLINYELLSFHVIDTKVKQLNEEKKQLKKRIITLMGEETTIDSRDYVATLTTQEKKLLDTSLLKDFLGENLFKYQKTSIAKTFKVSPKVG